jgi:hypothetical protein
MSAIEKIKNGFLEHLGTACAAAVTTLVGWTFYQITPLVIPAIESGISVRVLLAIVLLSLLLNLVLAILCWHLAKPKRLKLRYGILWDKDGNPHCPACKNPGVNYGVYQGRPSYNCRPCNHVIHLADANGKAVTPEQAIASLKA